MTNLMFNVEVYQVMIYIGITGKLGLSVTITSELTAIKPYSHATIKGI